jgi:hypothetical protein
MWPQLVALYCTTLLPLAAGLPPIIATMESVCVMTGREIWRQAARFWGRLFGVALLAWALGTVALAGLYVATARHRRAAAQWAEIAAELTTADDAAAFARLSDSWARGPVVALARLSARMPADGRRPTGPGSRARTPCWPARTRPSPCSPGPPGRPTPPRR